MIALLACLALLLTSGLLAAAYGLNKIINAPDNYMEEFLENDDDGYLNGVLIAWWDSAFYGCDMGPNPNYPTGAKEDGYDVAKVRATLWNMKQLGFEMVKIWLSINHEGFVFDEDGHVLGMEPAYKEHLAEVLEIADEYDIPLALTLNPHFDISEPNSLEYARKTAYIQNPAITQEYLKNWVKPLMQMVGEHDNVMMMEIYGEVEGDTDGSPWGLNRGTTWEGMIRFHNTVAEYIKSIDPKMTTTTASGNYYGTLTEYFNQMDLDYYACDLYYSDLDELKEVKDLNLRRPLMMGEYGYNSSEAPSDTHLMSYVLEWTEKAKELGYAGGFLWNPGYRTNEGFGLYHNDTSLRGHSSSYRFNYLDQQYEKTGYDGLDKPFMVGTVNQEFVSWMGSRGADSYILERSTDAKSWTEIAEIDSGAEYAPYLFKYFDFNASQGVTYFYRVTAVCEDERVTSDLGPTYTMKVTRCSEEDNQVKNYSFETGDFTDWAQRDWAAVEKVGDAHHGDYVLHVKGNGTATWSSILQKFDLKPNTTYTFTTYCKAVKHGDGNKAEFAMLVDGERLYYPYDDRLWIPISDEWTYISRTFTTNSDSEYSMYIPDCGADYYIDDIYLFEVN